MSTPTLPKKRAGFTPIVVDGSVFLYSVSLATRKVIVYNARNDRFVLRMINLENPIEGWRGKKGHGDWNKANVAQLIRLNEVR